MTKKAKVKFAFKPYALQQEIIDYLDGKHLNPEGQPYRFLVAALGRQSGKSWLAKYILLEYSVNQDKSCMWVAPTIPTARAHWNSLVKFIRDSGLENAGYAKINQTAKEIVFADGGSISVRSAIEPDNLRGASLDLLIMDEAAFYRNGKYVWWSVCLPMITATGGKVLFTTTPNGRNWVYDLFKLGQKADGYYKSWNVPSSASPYQDKKLLQSIKENMPSLQWREEFMAEFLPDGGGVFAGIERAARVKLMSNPDPDADLERYVAGIDIGFNNDYTVFCVIDAVQRKQVYMERFTNIGTIRTLKRIVELLDLWQPKITHIEKNGVGEHFVNLLKTIVGGGDISELLDYINDTLEDDDVVPLRDTDVGRHKIRAIHMNNDTKRDIVERLSADIEYGRLAILEDDDSGIGSIQISEMSTFERKPTNSGMSIKYEAAEGSHDDCVDALGICYKGVKKLTRRDILNRIKSSKQGTRGNPFRSRSLVGSKHRR
jgi:hypothetical protein